MSSWPKNLTGRTTQPSVSIVTPTFNRRPFIPKLIEYIKEQTYPAERMEWLVYDDGTDPIEDLLAPHMETMRIRYFRSEEKKNVGEKRNRLNAEAKGDIIICMDDDDYYSPERVSHVVNSLRSKPSIQICGSTIAYLYFVDDGSIWQAGPHAPNHATFGTMAYRKSYVNGLSHTCNEAVVHAEEIEFTRQYKEPMIQLDPRKVMLVICHTSNTVDKRKLRGNENPFFKKTQFKLRDFIKNGKHREFYTSLVKD
jgi:glycosyltransferase involved in cell wall biosynthesis